MKKIARLWAEDAFRLLAKDFWLLQKSISGSLAIIQAKEIMGVICLKR
ncbi:hypothetical protein [Adhaeribacter terreus]|uniref:Uncharacterized protein n=1 Tax=Adhaeribacter terreus TaxID=529703 RepID=A0ABW0E666_9BACT